MGGYVNTTGDPSGRPGYGWAPLGLGLVLPLALIVVILGADAAEGSKTAYVGVLAVVPMLAAVFGSPRVTALVALITWLAALGFGYVASDGNVAAQKVRLIIIALSGIAAVGAAVLRLKREARLLTALKQAALADQLREQAETDPLTGLRNRRGLAAEIAALAVTGACTVAIVDCDELKAINDEYGHQAGDGYLQAIAGRLAGGLSKQDLIGRWGGDEFLIVQRQPVDAAVGSLTRLQSAISDSPISIAGTLVHGAVSVGAAAWNLGTKFEDSLKAADLAMYDAKTAGGNCVVAAP
jgi:diguanylate cyclase (GGDEF)-like protein